MKKTILFSMTLAMAGIVSANEASDWSTEYANQALEYQKKNIELSCGYAENRWHTDFDGHKLFAQSLGETTARFENKVRKTAIEQCQNALLYAEQGVSQNEENINRRCGLSGAIWHSDKSKHFTWAMKQTPYRIAIHDQQRRYSLSLCESQ